MRCRRPQRCCRMQQAAETGSAPGERSRSAVLPWCNSTTVQPHPAPEAEARQRRRPGRLLPGTGYLDLPEFCKACSGMVMTAPEEVLRVTLPLAGFLEIVALTSLPCLFLKVTGRPT